MVLQTFVWWTLYILYKFVKFSIRHLGPAIDMSDVFRLHCSEPWKLTFFLQSTSSATIELMCAPRFTSERKVSCRAYLIHSSPVICHMTGLSPVWQTITWTNDDLSIGPLSSTFSEIEINIPWICYERSFIESYLSIWNQLIFNQRLQLFVQSPQPYLLIFAWRNLMCFPNILVQKQMNIWIPQKKLQGIETLI